MKIKLDEGAYLPIRGHETDAGLDLRTPNAFWLYSGHYLKIDTGVHLRSLLAWWDSSQARAV